MKSSPIYNIIHNPKRKSDCSFGSDGFSQDIRVGTSRTNSHTLGKISVQRHDVDGKRATFSLWLDGECIKRGLLTGKQFEFIGVSHEL